MSNWTTIEACALLSPCASLMPIPAAILWVAALVIVMYWGNKLHPIFADRETKD